MELWIYGSLIGKAAFGCLYFWNVKDELAVCSGGPHVAQRRWSVRFVGSFTRRFRRYVSLQS
jgi:hypothetical protein